jgi:hypothetical protein
MMGADYLKVRVWPARPSDRLKGKINLVLEKKMR